MDQQLKYSVISEVSGSEKIDKFRKQISSLPEAGVGLDQVSTKLGGLSLRMGVYGAIALGAYAAIDKGLDEIIAGEKVNAINAQFLNLSNSVGIVGEEMSKSLIKMTDGLIDDEDALQIATKGVAALRGEAARLPEVMAAARNVSKTLGFELKDTFGNLSSFIESGNTKVLRQYGIVLELSGAYEKAAKSIGVTAGELTEAQQQTVRLNLFLAEVPKKFNSAADSVTPLADSLARLKVSIANVKEEYSSGFAEFLTQKLVDNDDLSNVGVTRLRKESKEVTEDISRLSAELKVLNEERFGARGASEVSRYALQIDDVSKRLRIAKEESKKLLVELSGRSDQELFRALDESHKKASPPKIEVTEEQKAAIAKKAAEERKKLNDELKRETDTIEKFKIAQQGQIAQEKLQLESYKLSTAEISKQRLEIQIRTQSERESVKFHDDNKVAMAAATEEIIKQRFALVEQEEAQKRSYGVGAQNAFKKYVEAARDVSQQTENLFSNAFSNMEDMIVDFVKTGSGSFKQFADAVIDDIIRIAVRQAASGVFSIFSSFGGGGGGFSPAGGGAGSGTGGLNLGNPGVSVTPYNISGKLGSAGGQGAGVSVTVNVDASSNPSVSGNGGEELGKVIGATVKRELVLQMQPGGLLNRG